jgi:hypothetical protein
LPSLDIRSPVVPRVLPTLVLLLALLASASASAVGAQEIRPAPLPEDLRREAANLLLNVDKGDLAAAESAALRLADLREQAEIGNLTQVVAALLARFDRATATDSPARRAALLDAAVSLAPDFPPVRIASAREELSQGTARVGRAAGGLMDALASFVRYPRGLVVEVGNLAYYATAAFSILSVLVALLLVARRGPLLSHDVGDLFPAAPTPGFSVPEVARSRRARFIIGSGLTRILARAVVALLLLLPLAAGAGLLVAATCWIVLVVAYARRAEIVISILVLLAIASVTPLGTLVHLPEVTARSRGEAVWSCLREHCSPEAVRTLTFHVTEEPDDTWARASLAVHEVQSGPLRPASLAVADEHLRAAPPDRRGFIAALHANVSVLRAVATCPAGRPDPGSLGAAVTSYESALKDGGRTPEVLRGLAMAQGLLGDRTAMEATLKEVVAASTDNDLSFVPRIRGSSMTSAACLAPAAVARELRLPRLPDWALYLQDVDVARVEPALPWRELLVGGLHPFMPCLLAVVALILCVLVLSVRGRLRLAASCPRCGSVSCPSCNARSSGFDYCPTCLLEQVRPGFLDPLDLVAMQERRDARLRRGRTLAPVLGLLVPGSGQVLAGRPVRGALMLLLLAFAVLSVVMPVVPFTDPVGYTGPPGKGLPVLPPILLAVVYFFSAIDLWVNRSR